jgi:hypothetical protein
MIDEHMLAIRSAFAAWQQGQSTEYEVLRQAVVLYRIIQEKDGSLWPVYFQSISHYLPFEWREREIIMAAQALISQPDLSDEQLAGVIADSLKIGAPRGNTRSRKAVPGRTIGGLYITGEERQWVRKMLSAKGVQLAALDDDEAKREEDRFIRALFKPFLKEEYNQFLASLKIRQQIT